jgi:hypothetical protein
MSGLTLSSTIVALSLAFSILGPRAAGRNTEYATDNAPTQIKGRLANGVWGGPHIRMEVTGKGSQIEFDCAHSTIDEPIVLDRRGRFHVKGKFTAEHGGPIRRDEEPGSSPIRYAGEVKGKTLTLTITKAETSEKVGTFILTQGSEGRLMKCR